jgi:hypothetical protein
MSRLSGIVYCLIAVISLLSGEYLQASMWGCGAAVWLVTLGRGAEELSRPRRMLAYFFQAAFVVVVAVFILGYFGLVFKKP